MKIASHVTENTIGTMATIGTMTMKERTQRLIIPLKPVHRVQA
jgi:hypothetical protein